jgi:hypothetical protein
MLSLSVPDRDTLVYASIAVVYCICACIQLCLARSQHRDVAGDVAPDMDAESKEECIRSIAKNNDTKENEEIGKEWEYDEKTERIRLIDMKKDTEDEALRQKCLEWVNQSAHFMNRNELERVAEVLFNGSSTLKDFKNRPLRPNTSSASSVSMENFGHEDGGSAGMERLDTVTTDGSHFTYSSGYVRAEPTSFDDAVTAEDTYIEYNRVFNRSALQRDEHCNISNFTRQDISFGSAGTRGVRVVRGDAEIILGDEEE